MNADLGFASLRMYSLVEKTRAFLLS